MASAGGTFTGLDDPSLLDFMRGGAETGSGTYVTALSALHNSTVFRCVDLISSAIGMLPLHLRHDDDTNAKAEAHPLFDILHSEPNNWQTAMEFRSLMQMRALIHGNAYALIVRSGGRIIRLVPMDPARVEPKQKPDWSVEYVWTRDDGGRVTLPGSDVFHLRGLSFDGLLGLSRTRMAKEAIGLAMQTEQAAARLFRNGMMVGGALNHPGKLSNDALARLRESIESRYSGAENAHKWMVLEEGMTAEKFAATASDSQHIEHRKHQIEEIARVFGVPRPLLMMDDTSWGSGIEQLGIFFVQHALQPWFTSWEQAIARSLLVGAEKKKYKAKFNERALLRGTLKDQADFFAKALGSGGHSPWLSQNEVRGLQELSRSKDPSADALTNPMTQPKGEPAP
jgi:HK97 family phage portal protein